MNDVAAIKPLTLGRLAGLWLIALVALAAVVTLTLFIGSTGVGVPNSFRLDRVVVASLVGIGLGSAGVGYQSVLRNPLADPYLLGASSGAALAAYLWTLVGGGLALHLGQAGFAFAGALAAVTIVLALAGGKGTLEPTRAVLIGVVVSVLCGGLFFLFVQIFRTSPTGGDTISFLFGRVRSLVPTQYLPLAGVMLVMLVALAFAGRSLVDLADDETRAQTLGNVNRVRWLVLIIASLLVALTAAMAGPIGFVGLIAPHLARLIVGPDPRRVLPVATCLAGAMLAITDTLGRSAVMVPTVNSELPVGVLTNLLGAPFFLLLLYARRGDVRGDA